MFIRCLIIFLSLCQFSFSHELKPAIANLELTSDNSRINFELKIKLNLESVIADIEPDHDNTDQSKNSEKYRELRILTAKHLLKEFSIIKELFLSNIYFFNGSERIEFKENSIKIHDAGDVSLARESEVLLKGTFSNKNPFLKFYWNSSYGPIVLRVNKDREILFTKYLKTKDKTTFSTSQIKKQKINDIIKSYILIGFQHIVPKGLDHILFVVGLFLLSVRFKALIWQISSFTLAHTLTIFLGALHIVNIPPSIVEPIIAISIFYIGIENIFFKDLNRWRPFIVFIFGLLHGLGFAGILNEVGLPDSYFITSLIFFNLGVEIGQLFVIGICFLLIGAWFGKKDWYRTYLTSPISAIIAIIGFIWFVERIGFLF